MSKARRERREKQRAARKGARREEKTEDQDEKKLTVISGEMWDAFMRARINAEFRLLEAAEQGGVSAVDEVIWRLLFEVAEQER